MRVLVIGGGMFGSCAAIVLSEAGYKVDLVEREKELMTQASYVNHNRIHLGYHYLRSIETAEQSMEGLLSFMYHFGNSVVSQFPNYYAIAKDGSKTTTEQFTQFCDKVAIEYDEGYPDKSYLNPLLLDSCFKVPEPVFDFSSIKSTIQKRLVACNILFNTLCTGLNKLHSGLFEAKFNHETSIHHYDIVINATYAGYNSINHLLGLPLKKLLYEYVSIPQFKLNIDPIGLTIMDGPFCSIMPNGKNKNEFLLYSVDHSIIDKNLSLNCPNFTFINKEDIIYKESTHYLPFLTKVKRNGMNSTIRTVYENSDDARLTELFTYDDVPNYFSILSGKVTTCWQVALDIKHIVQRGNQNGSIKTTLKRDHAN
ncbi:MAG: FAD-binding oxidoreductase [Sphingobacteriia bacterium]|nr:MAG: FAD-binding oxidoreductase [Sphingobacteriia bacterium]